MAPARGEVWLLDLGVTEKVRPVLIVSADFGDRDRALITVIPHTTTLRGSNTKYRFRCSFSGLAPFLYRTSQHTRSCGRFADWEH